MYPGHICVYYTDMYMQSSQELEEIVLVFLPEDAQPLGPLGFSSVFLLSPVLVLILSRL